MAEPLPANPFQLAQPSYTAYNHVLKAEKDAMDRDHMDDIRNARIVGYTIIHAPYNQSIVAETLEHDKNSAIFEIGDKYLNLFILPFKKTRGSPSYTPSEISTPLYRQSEIDARKLAALPFPTDHKTAKRMALIRDGMKCVVSGVYDRTEVQKSKELQAKIKTEAGAAERRTNCTHIFPVSMNPSKPASRERSANVWQVIKMLGDLDDDLVRSLNGSGIHQLGNILTLCSSIRDDLDDWALWLEKVEGKDHHYRLCANRETITHGYPGVVVFQTSTPLPLPRADLLAVHAAACRVAHLSGAAEYLDLEEERDDEPVAGVWADEATFTNELERRLRKHTRSYGPSPRVV
ncbi:hypothetical protein K438DRAFT_1988526 [Mycena galopus ATCC 62051]|nr:hypothetical protein K438DRAFT_1988526 [Mycena galopus ATCC 62051]